METGDGLVLAHGALIGVESLPNLVTKLVLFVSSYAPLLVILWIRDALGNPRQSVILAWVALVSVVALFLYLGMATRLASHSVLVRSANSRDSEAMSYIVSYLLPFLGLDSQDAADRISLLVFLVMLAVLYIGSNLIHMNPVLNLFGFRIIEIESESGKLTTLITRRGYIPPNTEIRLVSLTDTVGLERPR